MNTNRKKYMQIGCIILTVALLLTGISSVAYVLANPKNQPGTNTRAAAVTDLGYGTVTLVFRQGDERINSDYTNTNGNSIDSWYNSARGEYLRYRDYVQQRYNKWVTENGTTVTAAQQGVETANAPT